MRIVPVALFFRDTEDLYRFASASAEVTHAHPVGIDGAAVLARAIVEALPLNPRREFPVDAFAGRLHAFAERLRFRQR